MESKKEPVSVIIPVLNRAELIVRCLDSVKAQSYRPIEIVVADNGSTDGTRKAVADWARENCDDALTLKLVSESRRGADYARNLGFEESSSQIIQFFDSDDILSPGIISAYMEIYGESPETDLVYWKQEIQYADGPIRRLRFSEDNQWRYHIYHGLLCTTAYSLKRELVRKAGLWNEGLLQWDDWEFGVRILLCSPVIKALPLTGVLKYHQDDSITGTGFSDKVGKWELAIDAVEKDIIDSDHPESDRLRDMVNYRRAILAAHYSRENHPEFAGPLLDKALSHPSLTAPRRLLLKLLYHYTALGGRGASIFWRR